MLAALLPMSAPFSELVTQYQAQVVGASLGVLADRARAEDVAQEAFVVAWRKLEAGEQVDNRPAWLCTIARNLARNASRKKREDLVLVDRAHDQPSALDHMLEREREVEVQRALDSLPEKYRLPLVMYYVAGESVREVADALALSEVAVRQRLDRGRERVRAKLGLVERSLRARRPGAAFTALVLAAWATRGKNAAAATGTGLGVKLALGFAAVASVATCLAVRTRRAPVVAPVANAASAASAAPSTSTGNARVVTPRPSAASLLAGPALPEVFPETFQRTLDIDLSQLSATAAFNLLGEAAEVPIVVAPGEDFSAHLNHKALNETVLEIFDELLAQAGAERRPARILDIRRGISRQTIDTPLVDVDSDGKMLEEVVASIAAQVGEPIYLPGSVASTPITVHVRGVTPSAALSAVLSSDFGFEPHDGFLVAHDAP